MIGTIATILTVSSILPQLYKTYTIKQVGHLSLLQMSILYFGLICWLSYGISINNTTVIVANSISVFLQTVMIGMKLKYDKKIKSD